ncbi:alpha-1A adrenergic receptor-like [Octopus vulgaris]|uniref:Alpha-1A adrenergic receptor-like n=1 Tax=Octopus vulgaris TaxID=6645 RepID=A0AA36F0F9_OCTVU|nr:alpha-1A adrenergic receptor-like [Octopus vulgaris]
MELDYEYYEDGLEFNNFTSAYYNSNLWDNATSTEPIGITSAIMKGTILGSICLVTIFGNVLVLLAVFVNSHLRSTTNYFIVNLAIADVLLGTLVLPFSASIEIIDYWAFGQTFCNIWAATDVLCCTASILSLCVISIDRYIGVTKPLQHSSIMTEKRAVYIIIAVWFLSVIISVAPLIGWKDPPDPNPFVCTVTKQLGYVIFSVSGSFYIPLLIIIIVYFRIYKEAEKQYRFLSTGIKTAKINENTEEVTLRIHTGHSAIEAATASTSATFSAKSETSDSLYQNSSASDNSDGSGRKVISRHTLTGRAAKFRRERKAAKTLGIVVGVFILCWFPFFFVLPLGALCERCQIPQLMFKIIFWLGYCNSTMNPIIYACSSKEFKRAFKRILHCQFRRQPRQFLSGKGIAALTIELHKKQSDPRVAQSFPHKSNYKNRTLQNKPDNAIKFTGSRKIKPLFRLHLNRELPLSSLCPDSPLPSLRLLQEKQRTKLVK